MERQPVVPPKAATIKLVQSPLEIESMLPNYRYEFQEGQVSEESQHMYSELLGFIETNQELVLNELIVSREDYAKGFQKAIALTRLWIDSIYLKNPES